MPMANLQKRAPEIVGLALVAAVVGAMVGALVGALVVGALVGAVVGAVVGALETPVDTAAARHEPLAGMTMGREDTDIRA